MRTTFRWLAPLLLTLSAGLSLLLGAGQTPGPGESPPHNRQVLEQWNRDPGHRQRLLEDFQAFKLMPADRQERIRKLDGDLRKLPPAERQRLWSVMERYAQWLKNLPATKRQEIEGARSNEEKLDLIRKYRDEEWYTSLPRKSREELDAIKDDMLKAERKQQLRALEQHRRREWVYDTTGRPQPPRKEKPTKLSEFPLDVQNYYDCCLRPLLTAAEREEVLAANDKPWPALAKLLLEKSEKHPLTLPGPVGPVRIADLPDAHKDLVAKGMAHKKLKAAENKWPEFGQALQDLGPRPRMALLPWDTTPTTPDMLPREVRDFVLDELEKVLTLAEREELNRARGKWPDYPRTIVKLAEQHKKTVPLMKLPPSDLWDRARAN